MGKDSDPLDLDWSRHVVDRDAREYGDGVFLAEAAARVGEAMIEYWNGDEAAVLADPDRPDPIELPRGDLAFDARGKPIPEVHAAWSGTVRRVLSPAAWADRELRSSDPDRWITTHVPDPTGGPPIPANALRARNGEDAADAITPANWDGAYVDTVVEHGLRRAAAVKMAVVARTIVELALAGAITMSARPLLHGPTHGIDGSIWEGAPEFWLRRFASCGFNAAAPHDASAPIDHLLFVGEAGFDAAVAEYAASRRITVESLVDRVWTKADAVPPRREPLVADKGLIFRYLRYELSIGDRSNWRSVDLEVVVGATFGEDKERLVPAVRDLLLREPRFAFLRSSGQPEKRDRPSLVGWLNKPQFGTPAFDALLERIYRQ